MFRCVATVLVTQGELAIGSHIIAGTTWARVRQMMDSAGKNVQSVSAGTPVTLSGWKVLPNAGDEVLEGKEDEVKSAVQNRMRNREQLALQADVKSINEKRLEAKAKEAAAEAEAERLRSRSRSRGMPASPPQPQLQRAKIQKADNELRLVIKADVSGSVEAVVGAIQGVGNRLVKAKIVQSSVGEPCEADVDLAQAIEGKWMFSHHQGIEHG
jgi:translation initiation factor IF-2